MRKREKTQENIVSLGRMKKKKKRRPFSEGEKWLLLSASVLLVIMMVYIGTQCKIEKVVVSGNETYTKDEVEAAVKEHAVNNTVYFTVAGALMKNDYLPFIEEMEVTYIDKNTVLVDVTEKLRAGMIEEMEQYFYFDKDGIVRETSARKIKNVPVVTGLQMKDCVLNEKIEPKEEGVFSVILKLTQLIIKHEIPVTELSFNTLSDIRLTSGTLQVKLGDAGELDAKMAELPGVLDGLYGRQGTINMENFTERNKIISFDQKSASAAD